MGSTTDTEGSGRRREWWVVGLLGLALGVSFGLSFGDPLSNHSLYLLEGLRQARPGLLNADWFLRETYQYHPRFSMLVALADRLGNLPWLLALGNVLAVAASLALVFRAFRSLDRHRALVGWLVAVLLFVVVDRTHAVAGSYFFSPSLQPATLATVALLAALVFFLEEAYLASGICLAVAGLLHINFLLLGFPFLGVAHLLLGRAGLLSRLLRQFALVSIVALFDLPVLIAATPLGASPADVSFARHVLMTIRARHHYDPHAFVPSLLLFAAWQLAACPLLREVSPDGLVRRRFQALYAAFLAVIAAGALLTTVIFVPAVAAVFFWRMTPFPVLLAQIVVARAVVTTLLDQPSRVREAWSRWRLVPFVLGLLGVIGCYAYRGGVTDYRVLILAGGGLIIALRHVVRARREAVAGARGENGPPGNRWVPVALVFAILALLPAAVAFQHFDLVIPKLGYVHPVERELYGWIGTTEPDAIFLIPPALELVRLFGQRAVVVDWKGFPFRPAETIEWYRRITAVAGTPDVASLWDAELGYAKMDAGRLRRLAETYHAGYAVFRRPFDPTPLPAQSVFENRWFLVLRVVPDGTTAK
jgi:hypothetical protein